MIRRSGRHARFSAAILAIAASWCGVATAQPTAAPLGHSPSYGWDPQPPLAPRLSAPSPFLAQPGISASPAAPAADPPAPTASAAPPSGPGGSILPAARKPVEDDPLAPRYLKDEHGHPFRVSFDPASRIRLGVAFPVLGQGFGRPASTEISTGVSYRNFWIWGAGESRISWQLDHRILTGWIRPAQRSWVSSRESDRLSSDPTNPALDPPFDAAVYGVIALRHDASPRAVLPTSPPSSFPFPFDLGFDTEVGHFSTPLTPPTSRENGAALRMIRAGVMRASLFLDPWRSGVPGRSLEIGVGARYDVDLIATRVVHDTWATVHRVAPFTATSLHVRWQDTDGLTALDARGDVLPQWTSEHRWATTLLASGHAERVLFAINDLPIALTVDLSARRQPKSDRVEAYTEIRGLTGLTFALNMR